MALREVVSLIEIRHEQPHDVDAVREVNRQAFAQEQEGRIIDALRERGAAMLSLVAVADDEVVGHIMFSPVNVSSLLGAALGPMAVVPAYQRRGIGSQLVERGLARLRAAGCPFIVVLGHPDFYPRFGFRPAVAHGLTCEWNVPPEAFMVNILDPQVADQLRGRVQYPTEFSTVE
jgi:putative acetyltransferase